MMLFGGEYLNKIKTVFVFIICSRKHIVSLLKVSTFLSRKSTGINKTSGDERESKFRLNLN